MKKGVVIFALVFMLFSVSFVSAGFFQDFFDLFKPKPQLAPASISCIDNDGGLNYFVSGNVTINDSNGGFFLRASDFCLADLVVAAEGSQFPVAQVLINGLLLEEIITSNQVDNPSNILIENYCDANQDYSTFRVAHYCSNGCIGYLGATGTTTSDTSGACFLDGVDCPQYPSQVPNFCEGGTTIEGGVDENNCPRPLKCGFDLSNGRMAEIKIIPEVASEKAITVLGDLDFTIELKEVGKGDNAKAVYEVKGEKQGRFLGIFKIRGEVSAIIDAETGRVIDINKPWWAFLASGI